jgi:hypothetical protein
MVQNYLHFHCAVTTRLRVKDLRRTINKLGFSGNITSRFKKRYLQLEYNIWGFSDMQVIFSALKEVNRLTIEGYSFAYNNTIYYELIKNYIKESL